MHQINPGDAMGASFKAAFGDWRAQLGIVIAGAAVFNFLQQALNLGLSPFFHRMLDAFRQTFHPPVDALLGWAPFAITPEGKDALFLYLIMGGAVSRTFLTLTKQTADKDTVQDKFDDWFSGSPIRRALGVLVCVIAWPVMLIALWRRPIVIKFRAYRFPATRNVKKNPLRWVYRRKPPGAPIPKSDAVKFDHDLRAVFMMQVAVALVVVGVFSALNGAGV